MAISNASNQIVKVNLIPGIIPSVLHLSQYDTGAGRPITFSVYDGSQAFTIPSGVSIAFEGTKPDGNGFSFTCSKSGSNVLLTNYTNQMTALSGKIMCQLVFTNTSGGRVGSLPILMVVTPAGINGDTVISDSDIEAIVAAQNQYAVLNAKLDTAISAVTQDSEVQDIRVKADGTTAATAGNAVRGQITELKNDLNNITNIDATLSDGYITGLGVVSSPTADAQKYSEFIPVCYGSTVEAIVTLSAAKYRNISIFGYAEDKSFIAKIGSAEGGAFATYSLTAKVNNQNIYYVRISFNAYNILTSCVVNTYLNGSEILDTVEYKIADAISPFSTLVHINLTNNLYDGYINSTNGNLMPQTADKQKATDYIPVSIGSKIIATLTLSERKYRNISIYGYDNNKTFVGRLVIAEGGLYDVITLEHIITNNNVFYVRFSFAAFDVLTSFVIDVYNTNADTLNTVDAKINSVLAPINSSIDLIKELDDIAYQYIDSSLWESGCYDWNASQTALQKNTVADGSPWYCLKIEGFKAGTYHYNKFCTAAFSFVENTNTEAIAKIDTYGVTETVNGTVTINHPFNLWLTINTTYFDKSIAMFADGGLPSEYIYGYYKDTASSNYVNAQGQTVWIVGEGYIPTIQAACDMASANDIIFIRVGTYTEQVSIWNKKLHLIGEDKANTILIDHSGAYNTPPLEMSLGSLSNMTIIEDGTQPTLQPGESGYNAAYCLHIEWTPPANEVFQIENCDFINYIHSPLGCGLYQDYTVHFKDCTFRCEATNEGNMERGSFYFHSNINPDVTGQKIIAENCIISSAGQKWAVLLGVPSGANNTGSAEARFSGCTIWNDNVGTADSVAYFDTTGGTDVLKVVHSCGNTVDVLNNW